MNIGTTAKTSALVDGMRNLARLFALVMFIATVARWLGFLPHLPRLGLDGRTGLMLIAVGLLVLLQKGSAGTRRKGVARLIGVAIMAIAIGSTDFTVFQARVDLLLAGFGILCLTVEKDSATRLAQFAALFVGASAAVSVSAQFYGLSLISQVGYFSQIPLYAALVLLAGAVAIFFAKPQTGPACIFVSPTAGGRLARRFLLPICLVLPLLGSVTGLGAHYEADLMIALLVLDVAVPVFVWILALSLYKEETDKVTIVNSIASGMVVADRSGRLIQFNRAAEEILRIGATNTTPEQWPAEYGIFLPDKRTLCPADQLPLVRAMRGETTNGTELFVCNKGCPQGVWIRANGFPLKDHLGVPRGGVAIFEDITARKTAESRKSMQYAIASIMAAASTIEEASPGIIEVLCNGMEWDCGTVWTLPPGSENFSCTGFWHAPDVDVADFEQSTRSFKCAPGTSLIGRAWATGQPLWSADVVQEPDFPRAPFADRSDLQAAFVFPLLLHDQVIGLIELFKKGPRISLFSQPDDLEMTLALGNQMGQFIERKYAEAQIVEQRMRLEEGKRSQERLHSLLEAMPHGMVMVKKDGTLALVNSEAETVLGYSRGELLGHSIDELVPPLVRSNNPAYLQGLFHKPHPREIGVGREVFGVRKDGTLVPLEVNINVLTVDEEEYVLVCILDITKRMEVEDKLKSQGKLLDLAHDSIMVCDLDGTILYWNRGAQEMYGFTEQQAIGQNAHYLLKTEGFQQTLKEIDRELLSTGWWDGELSHSTLDGRRIVVASRWALQTDAQGQPAAVMEINSNITERKHMSDLLQQKVTELERSNEDLQQFAYVCSHDLQEPLRTITNYTELFAKRYPDLLDEKANLFIEFIVSATKRMQNLINDLLAYSRVDRTGREVVEVDCAATVAMALANLKATIEESGAEINCTPLPTIRADASQLLLLFQNLLSNALKFRSEARPVIHISAQQEGKFWLFCVRDNGIGFDMKHANRIFVMFQRLHGKSKYVGTGIGLSICKKIVERHQGRIWVESEPAKGTSFYFTMPLAIIAEEQPDDQPDKSLIGGR